MSVAACRHPLAIALAGALATALVWYALASVTGLIFHFMPAGPPLVAAWIMRRADARPGRGARTAMLTAAASLSVATSFILVGAGRPLDEPAITAVAVIGGAVAGAWFLRPGRPTLGREIVDTTDVGQPTVDRAADE